MKINGLLLKIFVAGSLVFGDGCTTRALPMKVNEPTKKEQKEAPKNNETLDEPTRLARRFGAEGEILSDEELSLYKAPMKRP